MHAQQPSPKITAVGHIPCSRQSRALDLRWDDLDQMDIYALSLLLRQRTDAVWDGLDICPRTCLTLNAKLCTYTTWFARSAETHARSLLDLQCHGDVCRGSCVSGWVATDRLETYAWAGIPRLQRICNMCQRRTIGNGMHMVFECPAGFA